MLSLFEQRGAGMPFRAVGGRDWAGAGVGGEQL